MPRPVQITLPARQTYVNAGFQYHLEGIADVNLLATAVPAIKNPNLANMSPLLANALNANQYYIPWGLSTNTGQDMSQLNPAQLQSFNQVVWNRNVKLTSVENYSALLVTIRGFDTQGQAVSQVLAGPNNGFVVTTTKFAYITWFSCSDPTNAGGADGIDISVGWDFESTFVRLDYFYPSTAFSTSGHKTTVLNELGGTARYTIQATIQKPMITNSAGVPIPNPMPVFWDTLINNSGADGIHSTSDVYAAVKMFGKIWNNVNATNDTTNVTFTVLQQGLRS